MSDGSGEGEAPVWVLWRQVKRRFPVWSLLPLSLATPGAYGYMGVDVVSGLRRNPSTKAVFALFHERADAELEAVTALAALNGKRQRQIFTAVAVSYITIPLTLIATLAEIAPAGLEALIRANMRLGLEVSGMATVLALFYFSSLWRARQILEVLELVRIERGAGPANALEARDGEG
jgi:hypothetical protein